MLYALTRHFIITSVDHYVICKKSPVTIRLFKSSLAFSQSMPLWIPLQCTALSLNLLLYSKWVLFTSTICISYFRLGFVRKGFILYALEYMSMSVRTVKMLYNKNFFFGLFLEFLTINLLILTLIHFLTKLLLLIK